LSKVVIEVLDVSRKVQNRTGRYEAEHFHAAVIAYPQLPRAPADVDGGLLAADGIDAAVAA